ncbi:sugar phosphate isomerase/epimerase [Devosia algicola]|uniref:Sugar phosphate isomerase/epimerase n=1 Tax=Devosia algicola TaxID=3026418 RepID=A0ABY7YL02_9HYPH|nr:sugar phosphate isomerase/epimerase family protein [Devosia algicola]WDR01986.1 sugar phosphate isomerase/epimerase [Devosia algicola]
MATYRIAANMEFVRSADMDFRKGVAVAAELGYDYVEPMVHTGWELLSEVGYFHSFSMEEDPLLMAEICAAQGVKVSSISGHSPLMKPEAAVDRLTRAIVLADAVGARFVNTDEMLKPDWMNDEDAHQAMRYTLRRAEQVATRHKVYLCIEPHGVYTKTSAGLQRIVDLCPSPWIGVNWDTGNSYLAGVEDPYEGLERVRDKVLHVHAKDISFDQSEKERGKVTGTPVGCACGDGVVDWERVLKILDPLDREIIFSVECGTIDQARRSLPFLREVIGARLAR